VCVDTFIRMELYLYILCKNGIV